MELRRITVCQDCVAVIRRSSALRFSAPVARQWLPLSLTSSPFPVSPHAKARATSNQARLHQIRRLATASSKQPPKPFTAPDLNKVHSRVQELSTSVLNPEQGTLPAEERVLYVLEQLEYFAKLIQEDRGSDGSVRFKAREQKETATSALLGSVNARSYPAVISKASILSLISGRAEEIMRHPDVFITSGVLKSYVQLQSLLHQPSSFPDVFDLYARKPVPALKGSEVIYSAASPKQIKSAVPSKTAEEALAAAIEAHQLALAVDIISTSYCTPAFKKAKTFKQAAFPMAGLAVAPLAAYTLSQQFSHLQQTMDTGTATGIAFAGIMTYVGAVAMTGYVAVTTSNDQMDRVTWATGVPLWERWVREEERAAIDQLAGAWGFKDMDKRGEEEGEEWEALREWVGSRGMVLDRVSLMPGME